MATEVSKGDRFIWGDEVSVEVLRVAKDGTWADIRCSVNWVWTKRQPLPLPDSFRRDGRDG